jgi:hypothetical protein
MSTQTLYFLLCLRKERKQKDARHENDWNLEGAITISVSSGVDLLHQFWSLKAVSFLIYTEQSG